MIVGVILLAVLATVLLLTFLGRGGDPPAGGSPGTTASGSAPASAAVSGAASPTDAVASGSAGGSAEPSASAGALEIDGIAVTTVDALSVRASPGTSAERLGSLANGTPSFLVAGPTMADGHPWYLVSALGLPPNSGCAGPLETDPYNCPAWFGWVAGADEAGEPWLRPGQLDCPPEPLTAEGLILGRTALERLACFGAEPFTFRVFWPIIPDGAGLGGACLAQDAPSGWLLCQNINYNHVTIDETEDFLGGVGVRLSIDPASGVVMPERGTWIEVTVHLDDPAAQSCDEDAASWFESAEEKPPERWVLDCRAELVVESATAVDGP